MAEYIEREALEAHLNRRLRVLRNEYGDYDYYANGYDEAVCTVEDFHAADVAPVVRCKDCVSGMVEDGHKYIICCQLGIRMDFDDFCSYGVRTEDQ